jgi:hypothetical protein
MLSSIEFGPGLRNIGEDAFAWCENLYFDGRLPIGIAEIQSYAFHGTAITELILPDSVTVVGSGAFGECYYLRSVWFPESLHTIEAGSFDYSRALSFVWLPDSLRKIGAAAFANLDVISLSISGQVTDIDPSAFGWYGYDALLDIHIRGTPSDALCAVLTSQSLKIYVFVTVAPPGGIVCGEYEFYLELPATVRPTLRTIPPAPSRSPEETLTPLPTTDVNKPPSTVVVDQTGEIEMDAVEPGVPIVINGASGTISGTFDGEPADLHFDNVTIRGGDITAVNLIVDSYLELGEGTTIKPPSTTESIRIQSGAIVKFVSSDPAKLPEIDLGSTAGYETAPAILQIDAPAEQFTSSVHKLIVKGDPFGRCNDWARAVRGLPNGIGAKCESISSGKSILSGQVGLYLTEARDEGDGNDDPGGLSGGVIAAIVIVVIVVVGAAAGGAYWWFFVKKGKDGDDQAAA